MVERIYIILILIILIIILSCAAYQSQNKKNDQPDWRLNNPLIVGLNENIDFKNISPNDITDATKYVLNNANLILEEILTVSDLLRTFDNTLLRLDDLYNHVSKVWNPVELLSSVSDNKTIRIACDESSLIFIEYFFVIFIQNRKIHYYKYYK